MTQRLNDAMTRIVLVFYCMTLLMQCAAPCFAETSALEGKIIGTGQFKVWLNIGTDKGVETDMVFSVKRGDELIAKVNVKKAGKSSSEAEITELKEGASCQAGDTIAFLSKAAPEKQPEPKKEETKTEETKPELKNEGTKKDGAKPVETTATAVTTTASTPAVETKPEEKKQEAKKPAKKKKKWLSFSSTQFLYIAIIGVAALAISGGGKKSSGGSGAADPVQTSQNPPSTDSF